MGLAFLFFCVKNALRSLKKMTKKQIIESLNEDDIFLLACKYFAPFGMNSRQIIFALGVERLFADYKLAIETRYNSMVEEERLGKVVGDDGEFIDINDLDDESYEYRNKLFDYYLGELIKCVDIEKKDKRKITDYNIEK